MSIAQWVAGDYPAGAPPGGVTAIWRGSVTDWTILTRPDASQQASVAFTGDATAGRVRLLQIAGIDSNAIDTEIRGRFFYPGSDSNPAGIVLGAHMVGVDSGVESFFTAEVTVDRDAVIRFRNPLFNDLWPFTMSGDPVALPAMPRGWYYFLHVSYNYYETGLPDRYLLVWPEGGSSDDPICHVEAGLLETATGGGFAFGVMTPEDTGPRPEIDWLTIGTEGDAAPLKPRVEIFARIDCAADIIADIQGRPQVAASIDCVADIVAGELIERRLTPERDYVVGHHCPMIRYLRADYHLPLIDMAERHVVTFDFTPQLNQRAGETLTNATVSVDQIGGPATARLPLDGLPQREPTQVLQRIGGTIDGVSYIIMMTVTTTLGRRLTLSASLRVSKWR